MGLKLLTMSEYITEDMGASLLNDCLEITKHLIFYEFYVIIYQQM